MQRYAEDSVSRSNPTKGKRMNNEEVDRLLAQAVREAGPNELYKYRFANLVAAAEREACAVVVEQAGMDGYGTLAAALLVRERGAP
jgi:hypothetical protein